MYCCEVFDAYNIGQEYVLTFMHNCLQDTFELRRMMFCPENEKTRYRINFCFDFTHNYH